MNSIRAENAQLRRFIFFENSKNRHGNIANNEFMFWVMLYVSAYYTISISILFYFDLLQPSESTGVVSRKSTDPIPTTVVSPVLVSSPPPPALTSKKHPKDKVPRVGTCGPPVSKSVPKFFWPEGKPTSNTVLQNTLTKAECKLKEENNCVNYDKFGEVHTYIMYY